MDGVAAELARPATLCLAWGAGAAAWAMCQILPVILQTAWNAREARKAAIASAELAKLKEEWGLTDIME